MIWLFDLILQEAVKLISKGIHCARAWTSEFLARTVCYLLLCCFNLFSEVSRPVPLIFLPLFVCRYLDHNLLFGTIPKQIGSLRNLRVLDLSSNRLTGPIPSELSGLSSVTIM
jgi:hypothetical protein